LSRFTNNVIIILVNLPCGGQLFLSLARSKKPFYFKPKEKDIEKSICDWLRIKGVFFRKIPMGGYFDTTRRTFRKHTNPYVGVGISDLLLCWNGRWVSIEVKRPGGKQTGSQIEFERELKTAGGVYFLVNSIEGIAAVCSKLENAFGPYLKT
jgi:hypothetical protein